MVPFKSLISQELSQDLVKKLFHFCNLMQRALRDEEILYVEDKFQLWKSYLPWWSTKQAKHPPLVSFQTWLQLQKLPLFEESHGVGENDSQQACSFNFLRISRKWRISNCEDEAIFLNVKIYFRQRNLAKKIWRWFSIASVREFLRVFSFWQGVFRGTAILFFGRRKSARWFLTPDEWDRKHRLPW